MRTSKLLLFGWLALGAALLLRGDFSGAPFVWALGLAAAAWNRLDSRKRSYKVGLKTSQGEVTVEADRDKSSDEEPEGVPSCPGASIRPEPEGPLGPPPGPEPKGTGEFDRERLATIPERYGLPKAEELGKFFRGED